MKRLIALTTVLFALNAAAECPSSIPPEMPEMPNGATANEGTMLDARLAAQAYVATIEAFLDCRDLELADSTYNELVDRAIAAADSYNREVRRYHRHEGLVAKN